MFQLAKKILIGLLNGIVSASKNKKMRVVKRWKMYNSIYSY